jgi:phosphatidylglycerol:prolipoprotein diacylglycerol transferase
MKIHPLSGFLPSVKLFGVVVPVYFLVTALAFIFAMLLLVRRADAAGLSRNRALDTSLVLMIFGFVGSRLFHVFFEEPAYYRAHPILVFDIWSGGFVWYGGAVLGTVASILFLRWKKEPIARWLDLFAPVCALGYSIGRMACVLTGCCYGRVFEMGGELYRHPTQSYAVIWGLGVLALLLFLEKRWVRRDGQLFLIWLALHACGRIFMEAFRDDPRGPALAGLSVSTWISIGLLVLSLGWLVVRRSKTGRFYRI